MLKKRFLVLNVLWIFFFQDYLMKINLKRTTFISNRNLL